MDKSKFYLGIYTMHNSTVALIGGGGELIEAINEERFKKEKNYTGFPYECIKYIKEKYNLNEKNIGGVSTSFKYMPPEFITGSKNKISFLARLRHILRLGGYYLPFVAKFEFWMYTQYMKLIGRENSLKDIEKIAKILDIKKEKIFVTEHHLAHTFASYFCSPFNTKKSLVLTLDGEGDLLCATVNIAEGNKITRIASTTLNNSLGNLYMYLTKYFGMKMNEHEYKIMGLAAYSKDKYLNEVYDKIKDLIIIDPENRLNFKAKFDTHLVERWYKKNLYGYRFDNIAGAFQKLVEERIVEWVKNCIEYTGIKTLCLGGGVFMNIKANQRISELEGVEELFIFPSCGDESTAIGAAINAYFLDNPSANITSIKEIYFGPCFSNDEILKLIQENNLDKKYIITKQNNMPKKIANLLSKNEIVGVFQGKMEFGARALGNRSILANPSDYKSVNKINEIIKNRDFWMPFAGTILFEKQNDYLINPKNIFSPYMMLGFNTTKKAENDLISAIHNKDFSMRPQILKKEWNSRYYQIIKEFEKLTGIGGVLNTSLNLHGFPIAMEPKDALFIFEKSGLNYLALEDYLIEKII